MRRARGGHPHHERQRTEVGEARETGWFSILATEQTRTKFSLENSLKISLEPRRTETQALTRNTVGD